jgi:hypothetical protein
MYVKSFTTLGLVCATEKLFVVVIEKARVFPPSSILLLVSCLWLRLGAYLQCGQDKVCTSGHSKLG